MRLKDYIQQSDLNYTSFAKRVGSRPQAVQRWCLPFGHKDRRIPREKEMEAIVTASGGAVTANDFYDIADPAAGGPAPSCAHKGETA